MFAIKLSKLTTKLGNISNIFSFKLPMQLILKVTVVRLALKYCNVTDVEYIIQLPDIVGILEDPTV